MYWLYTVVELILMSKQRLKDTLCQEQQAILLAMVAIPHKICLKIMEVLTI